MAYLRNARSAASWSHWGRAARAALVLVASAVGAGPVSAQSICPAFRWVTLGTAAGPVPTEERSEPANLLVAGDRHFLVDTGDGTVDQLARVGLELGSTRTVFISHHHMDHTGGLAAVIGLRWMNQFPGQLTVYGPPGTAEMVDAIVASAGPQSRIGFGVGRRPPPPRDSVRTVELTDGSVVDVEGVRVTAAANSHFDSAGARAPAISLSYRFDFGGRSITYTGDTGPSAAVTRLARNSDLFVSEVIDVERLMTEVRRRRVGAPPQMLADLGKHLATHHLSAAEVGRMAAQAGIGHVVLTHFGIPGPLAASESGLRAGVRESYHGPLDLARDLASYDVGCR